MCSDHLLYLPRVSRTQHEELNVDRVEYFHQYSVNQFYQNWARHSTNLVSALLVHFRRWIFHLRCDKLA